MNNEFKRALGLLILHHGSILAVAQAMRVEPSSVKRWMRANVRENTVTWYRVLAAASLLPKDKS